VTKEAVNEQENIVKQHLRNNTLNLAHSFHAEHIEKLTFTADDVESPYFQRISEQIKNYFYYSGIQGIYTIKERGRFLFWSGKLYA